MRAIDEAANADDSPAVFAWSVDTVAPTTTIDEHPPALIATDEAHFAFSATDPGGSGVQTLQCRRDGAAWASCGSPQDYSGLADGPHSFEARAIDNAANTGAADSFEWTVDTTPPAPGIDSGPTGLTNDSTPTFTFHPGEEGATVQCSLDEGTADFGPCTDAGSYTPESPLPDGPWTFRVRATDEAGNSATATRDFEVDTASPQAPVLSGTTPASPANENQPKVQGSAPAGATVKLYAGTDCSGPPLATATAAGLESGITVSVADDSTTSFAATATSVAGSVSACSTSISYVEDSSSPQTEIDSGPTNPSFDTNAQFTFSGSDMGGSGVSSFECRLDSTQDTGWTPCDSPASFASLADGAHDFQVRAIDLAGNADDSPATYTWSIDTSNAQTSSSGTKSGPETSESDELALRTPVRLLRIGYNVRRGTAILLFEVPGPGTLSASAPTTSLRKNPRGAVARKGIRWRKAHAIEPRSVKAKRSGKVKLRIKLSQAGRRLLRENTESRSASESASPPRDTRP